MNHAARSIVFGTTIFASLSAMGCKSSNDSTACTAAEEKPHVWQGSKPLALEIEYNRPFVVANDTDWATSTDAKTAVTGTLPAGTQVFLKTAPTSEPWEQVRVQGRTNLVYVHPADLKPAP